MESILAIPVEQSLCNFDEFFVLNIKFPFFFSLSPSSSEDEGDEIIYPSAISKVVSEQYSNFRLLSASESAVHAHTDDSVISSSASPKNVPVQKGRRSSRVTFTPSPGKQLDVSDVSDIPLSCASVRIPEATIHTLWFGSPEDHSSDTDDEEDLLSRRERKLSGSLLPSSLLRARSSRRKGRALAIQNFFAFYFEVEVPASTSSSTRPLPRGDHVTRTRISQFTAGENGNVAFFRFHFSLVVFTSFFIDLPVEVEEKYMFCYLLFHDLLYPFFSIPQSVRRYFFFVVFDVESMNS